MDDSIRELFDMLPVPFPLLISDPGETASLKVRVQRLEGTVLLLLDVVQIMAEKIDRSHGQGAVGENLGPLAGAGSESEAISLVDAIDHEMQSGNKPGAVRKVRDEFGCTWDHALQFIGQWQSMQRTDRIRFIRLSKMMRYLEAASKSHVEKAVHP